MKLRKKCLKYATSIVFYVYGKVKFESEVVYGLKVPEDQRVFIKTKDAIEEEETMKSPHGNSQDEIIASHFDSKIMY